MDIFRIQCFLRAAAVLNLSEAASQMHITQPAMSMQIKKLEQEIGVPLFERQPRSLVLTPAGEIVKRGFSSMMGTYSITLWQAKNQFQALPCLRVGYHGPVDWAGISGLFRCFLRENPDLRLQIQQAEFAELAEKLEAGELDVAFLEWGDMENHDNIKWTFLFEDQGCFAMSQTHPLSGRSELRPEELGDQKVYFNMRNSASMKGIFQMLLRAGIHPENLVCVEGTETAIMLADACGGVAAVPRTFKCTEYPSIAYVDNTSDAVRMRFGLGWRTDNENRPVIRFADCCSAYLWPKVEKPSETLMEP